MTRTKREARKAAWSIKMSQVKNTVVAASKFGIGFIHTTSGGAIFEGITKEQETQLIAAVGESYCTDSNPCGVCFYYDADSKTPFRIADDHAGESFATFAELLESAKSWNN